MRLTITTKLGLGVGAILAPFLIGGPIIFVEAERIRALVARMSLLDQPASAAIHEMEINLAETGLALKAYVHEPSGEALERLRGEEQAFREAYGTYHGLLQTEEARRAGSRVKQAYERYLAVARELIRLRKEQSALLENYLRLERSLDESVEERIEAFTGARATAKLGVAMELEVAGDQMARDLSYFLRSRDAQHEIRAKQFILEFGKLLDRLETLNLTPAERRWAVELRSVFGRTVTLAEQLIEQERKLQSAWVEAIDARVAVSVMLDEELEGNVRNSLAGAQQELQEVGRRGTLLVFTLLPLAMIASVVVALMTARSISQPLRRLLSAVEAIGRGQLSQRVTVSSSDESAELASAFNRMMEELQSNTVARSYVEGIIRSMSESLVVVSADGAVATANPAACVLLGYREPELVGLPFTTVLAEWPTVVAQVAASPVHDLDTVYRTRDGRSVPVLLYADRLQVADGAGSAVVCLALDMAELKRSQHELAESREQLRELARYLNATVEAERAQMAREVHDQLGQAMTSLKFDLHWLGQKLEQRSFDADAAVRERIGSMSHLIDGTIRTVRKVATDLRPAVLDDLGLGPALETLAEQFSERTGIASEVDLRTQVSLTAEQSTAFYRIAQEALTNVARHADAQRVRIVFRSEKDAGILEIEDDGRGITPSEIAAPSSLGLLGMQERAREMGGAVQLVGKPEGGTTVRIAIPFVSAARRRWSEPSSSTLLRPDPASDPVV